MSKNYKRNGPTKRLYYISRLNKVFQIIQNVDINMSPNINQRIKVRQIL